MSTEPGTTWSDRDAELLDLVLAEAGQRMLRMRLRSLDSTSRGELRGYSVVTADVSGREETVQLYVEPAGSEAPRDGVLRVHGAEGEVDVWSYPQDPALPALAAAAHPAGARRLLERLGIPTEDPLDVHATSYRPHRRAAVRVQSGEVTVYLKVVPPGKARAIAERHLRWAEAGISVPRALAWSDDGLIALSALEGRSAADLITDFDDPAPLADAIDDLRRRFAAVAEPEAARRSLAARSSWYRDRLGLRHAELVPELTRIEEQISRGFASSAPKEVTIHGDLHLAQLIVAADGMLSVLDLDTGGRGDAANDDAGLWAHLVSIAYRSDAADDPQRRDAALRMIPEFHPRRSGDGERIVRAAAIAATQLLGHALSGAIPAEDAVQISAELLDRPDENPLIPVSDASHPRAGS